MQYRNSGASEEHVIQNQFTAYLLVALRRRKSAFLSRRDSHQQHEQPIKSSDNVFASAYDMEDAVCRALDLQTEYAALMRLLEKLQERDRMIFLSRALEERSFAELADEFHIGYIRSSRDLLPHDPANQKRNGGTIMNFLELLICAKAGDNEAAERILTMYQPILVKESVLDGALDEDLYQELCLQLFLCIRKFRI